MDKLGGAASRRIVRTVEEAQVDSPGVVAVGAVGAFARAVLRINVRVRGVEHVAVHGGRDNREVDHGIEIIARCFGLQRARMSRAH